MKSIILFGVLFLNCYRLVLSQEIEVGVVLDSVKCVNDASQSYATYIPSNYSLNREWPIVYIFEPAARGSLPINNYSPVAEELGFILVCSNNSKNGSWDLGLTAADAVFLDTQQRFKIDKNLVFTSGFSGGSRLALSIAVITKQIRGVIGVGAAQPPVDAYKMSKNSNFLYAGLVGNRDMNYQEHKQFSKTLGEWGKPNILIISELTHQWASPEDFRIAMLWMLNNSGISQADRLKEALSNKLDVLSDTLSAWDKLRMEAYISPSENSKGIDKKQLKKEEKILNKEIKLRLQFRDSLNRGIDNYSNSASKKWMINTIAQYKNRMNKTSDINLFLMYHRVLDYVRAISIETGFRLLNAKEYDRSKLCIEIWSAYLSNPRIKHWWWAKIAAMQHDETECLMQLDLLVDAGFNDSKRVEEEEAFDNVRNHVKYQEIVRKMKNN
ncbi:hypothetical protein [Ekhidna sp.]|uniref:hypothetical protein n=1 Tax=Ekhidna sp. TaxID=2608089 RepID=UPI003C7D0BBC